MRTTSTIPVGMQSVCPPNVADSPIMSAHHKLIKEQLLIREKLADTDRPGCQHGRPLASLYTSHPANRVNCIHGYHGLS